MRISSSNFAVRLACLTVCAGLGAFCIAIGLAGAAATTARAADEDSRLGIVHFTAPAGWQSAEQAGRDARVFVSPDSSADRQAAIVVLLTQPVGQSFDFRARFEKAVDAAADGQPIIEHGPILTGKSRQGCDTLEQTFSYKNASGQTVRGRLVAARVGDRLTAFCYLATGESLFRKHADDLVNLLSTVRFEGLPATLPATSPVTLPATIPEINPELQAIEREKAELQRRLADLESKEKGLNAASATEPATAARQATGAQPATNPAAGSIDVTDRGLAGGSLRTHYPRRTRLVLTLTPAPSGNPEIRTIACDIDRLPETAHFTGFPTGTYRLTAKAVTPDDRAWPLKVTTSATPQASDWADAVEVDPSKGAAIGVTDMPK